MAQESFVAVILVKAVLGGVNIADRATSTTVSQKMSLQTIVENLATAEEVVDCSLHDALTDQADWNAEFWDFHIDQLRSVKDRIRKDYVDSSRGIAFAALWVSDSPKNEIETTIDDLLERFDRGKIGTRDRYIIKKSG